MVAVNESGGTALVLNVVVFLMGGVLFIVLFSKSEWREILVDEGNVVFAVGNDSGLDNGYV